MSSPLKTPPKLLVVEDESILAMEMSDVLEKFGCVIVGPVAHLDQAVDLARSQGIDFAVLDVNLSDSTSRAVADALKDRGIPFIFITGDPESIDASHRDIAVLHKPVRWAELRMVLSKSIPLADEA